MRHKEDSGFYVENLFVVQCESLQDCLAVLSEGMKNRRKAAHAMNEHSSRSHSILTLNIDSELQDSTDYHIITKHGKISFVDLAGSERVKETKSEGDTLVETGMINKSLLTLGMNAAHTLCHLSRNLTHTTGNCISALSDPKKKHGHIPYRDSKLTRLLADSLGGSGLALMVSCGGSTNNRTPLTEHGPLRLHASLRRFTTCKKQSRRCGTRPGPRRLRTDRSSRSTRARSSSCS